MRSAQLFGLCNFDLRHIDEPRRNMLLGNNLRRTSQNSLDLASGLKRVRFAQGQVTLRLGRVLGGGRGISPS